MKQDATYYVDLWDSYPCIAEPGSLPNGIASLLQSWEALPHGRVCTNSSPLVSPLASQNMISLCGRYISHLSSMFLCLHVIPPWVWFGGLRSSGASRLMRLGLSRRWLRLEEPFWPVVPPLLTASHASRVQGERLLGMFCGLPSASSATQESHALERQLKSFKTFSPQATSAALDNVRSRDVYSVRASGINKLLGRLTWLGDAKSKHVIHGSYCKALFRGLEIWKTKSVRLYVVYLSTSWTIYTQPRVALVKYVQATSAIHIEGNENLNLCDPVGHIPWANPLPHLSRNLHPVWRKNNTAF